MFGKLKDKLKGALNVFSKKAEEVVKGDENSFSATEATPLPEAEEKEVEQEVKEVSEEQAVEEVSEEVKESKEEVEEPEQVEEKEEVVEEVSEEPEAEEETPVASEESSKPAEVNEPAQPTQEEVKESTEETPAEAEPIEDKEEDISEEELERADQLIEETNKENKEEPKEEDEKFVPIPEDPEPREIPSAESLIEETKEKFAVEELPQEEQEKIKEAERQPTAAELLEEVAEEPKEKKLFGLFKRKEKKEEVPEEKEPVIEEKVIEKKEIKEEETKEKPKEEEKKGFFGKVKQSLTTKTISADKFETLFWELEMALLENNVSVEVIEKIKEDLKEELVEKPLPRDVPKKIEETLKNTLNEILTFDKIDILGKAKEKKPLIIAFFGINGSGKTTSIAKLANYFKENNLSVVLAACDTFRAAAIQQLEEHANKLEVKMIKHDYGSDAAAVAFDAVKYAEKNNVNVVLIDTAGRLHSNTNLMQELEKIIRITDPDLKIFVGESITGNDCIEQAKKFNELVEMDGAILTKADVDEKGGAPLSIAYTIKKPILFLGMGQEYKDLEEFDKEIILGRLGF